MVELKYLDGNGILKTIPKIIKGIEITELLPKVKYKNLRGMARCKMCGVPREVRIADLQAGNGLVGRCCSYRGKKNSNYKHGAYLDSSTKRVYNIYHNMRERCYNPNNPDYERYGGRGVTICELWLSDFNEFLNWSLANGYDKSLTIDKDKIYYVEGLSGPLYYGPDRCSWLSLEEQQLYRKQRKTK